MLYSLGTVNDLGKFCFCFRELLIQIPGSREGLTLPSGLSKDSGLWPLCELSSVQLLL